MPGRKHVFFLMVSSLIYLVVGLQYFKWTTVGEVERVGGRVVAGDKNYEDDNDDVDDDDDDEGDDYDGDDDDDDDDDDCDNTASGQLWVRGWVVGVVARSPVGDKSLEF